MAIRSFSKYVRKAEKKLAQLPPGCPLLQEKLQDQENSALAAASGQD